VKYNAISPLKINRRFGGTYQPSSSVFKNKPRKHYEACNEHSSTSVDFYLITRRYIQLCMKTAVRSSPAVKNAYSEISELLVSSQELKKAISVTGLGDP
jgi:hypothetical protein